MARTPKTADTVTVACKLPQGLSIPMPSGPNLELYGALSAFALAGYGMTDVKASLWDTVTKQYADAAWLKNEAVFAMGDRDSAADKAEEMQGEKIGFEPVDPLAPGKITPAV